MLDIYYYGQRWPTIHHTRMRLGCSKLNHDLHFGLHVLADPSCMCGHADEDATHFLLACPRYTVQRNELFNAVVPLSNFNVKTLLYGDTNLNLKSNTEIFKAVHTYITESQRFEL